MINPNDYDYVLPPEQVAKEPASPRDSSRLFVYDTQRDHIILDTFKNLSSYLPANSFLVLNTSKVVPSRITLYKETGGKVITLFLVNEVQEGRVNVILDRKAEVGQILRFDQKHFFRVIGQNESLFELSFNFSIKELLAFLEKNGTMPIPPYLKDTKLKERELRKKYQTIFAKEKGSAAAPTASLHFTNRVFKKLEKKGIEKTYIQLHVGLGTFSPVFEQHIKEKRLHKEWFEVSAESAKQINAWKKEGRRLVSVGTTVTRTLESAAIQQKKGYILKPQVGETEIFIYPPYEFKLVDSLITNFHVPKSSLMMLVDAFLKHKGSKRSILDFYNIAIQEKFRFFSFGDAMLLL